MSRSGSPDRERRKLDRKQPEEVGFARLYRYDKLEGNDDIRLIALLPGPFHGIIRVEFIICDLKDPPDYEALSYTWADLDGDQSLDRTVWCEPGCQKISVTRNCEDALRRLRLQHETRFLWVDADSINQTVIPERNRQVSLMPRIYHSASRVIVYLGEATAGTDEFMDCLNNEQLHAQLGFERSIPPGLAIFSRRWFGRLWVLQEISLARAADIICGDRIAPWKKLFEYYKEVFSHSGRIHNFQHLKVVFEYGLKGIRPMESLPKIFTSSYRQSCSDPRDRVFALLGIVAKDHSLEVMPQYGASHKETFTKLAIYFLREFNVLFVSANITPSLDDWPSWVLDWSRPRMSPNYPLTIDNLMSLRDLGNGRGALEISGRKVMHGIVRPRYSPKDNERPGWAYSFDHEAAIAYRRMLLEGREKGGWGSIRVTEGVTYSEDTVLHGLIVVEVSQDFHVLLLRKKDHYALVGGISDFQRCQERLEIYKTKSRMVSQKRPRRVYQRRLRIGPKIHTEPGECTSKCLRPVILLDELESFLVL